MPTRRTFVAAFTFSVLLAAATTKARADVPLDQRPAGPEEWGYRPAEESSSAVNPPSFSWRPQKGIVTWELECRGTVESANSAYRAQVSGMNCALSAQHISARYLHVALSRAAAGRAADQLEHTAHVHRSRQCRGDADATA